MQLSRCLQPFHLYFNSQCAARFDFITAHCYRGHYNMTGGENASIEKKHTNQQCQRRNSHAVIAIRFSVSTGFQYLKEAKLSCASLNNPFHHRAQPTLEKLLPACEDCAKSKPILCFIQNIGLYYLAYNDFLYSIQYELISKRKNTAAPPFLKQCGTIRTP